MTATSRSGCRKASRLIRLGLPGVAAVLVLTIIIASLAGSRPAAAAPRGGDGWVTSWGASPQAAAPGTLAEAGFDDQTVRDIIVTSVGGDPIRLELTNAFGTVPLRVGRVTVAVAGPGAAVTPGVIHPVTFGGSASFPIPAGGQVLSDPVNMRVQPMQALAVSVYLPDRTGPATYHADAQQVNWVSVAGDYTAEEGPAAFAIPTPFGATLLPFRGAGYYTAAGEAVREAVNAWIRTGGAFDGVIDSDKVMRDPADPLRLNPGYDSGDHLHPNDAGYRAMADAISLRMLLPRGDNSHARRTGRPAGLAGPR